MAKTNGNKKSITEEWDEALDTFKDVSDMDIRKHLSYGKSIEIMLKEQQEQLFAFKDFRNNESSLRKLGSTLNDNSNYVITAAEQFCNLASVAFPPASAILLSFTWIISASQRVSDDLNLIESFFALMQCFLRRLCILKGKIPSEIEFQRALVMVFSSMLTMSGLARYYRHKGRFKLWVSSLVKGGDLRLRDAYDALQENLRGLESAVMLQTLKTVIDTRDDVKSLNDRVMAMQETVDTNLGVSIDTRNMAMDIRYNITTLVEQVQEMERAQRDMSYNITALVKRTHEEEIIQREMVRQVKLVARNSNPEPQMKIIPHRPTNFERLKTLLNIGTSSIPIRIQLRQQELLCTSVPRVFKWITNDDIVQDIIDNKLSVFWITGASGMGKSTMAFKLFRNLKD